MGYFGSYYMPRNKLWVSGVFILFVMIGTAFMGYVLPWGQMSFWAATVITNLVSVIPFWFYYIIKDIYGFVYYFLILCIIVFYYPNLLGHSDNYILANPVVTPAHIVPEWYFF